MNPASNNLTPLTGRIALLLVAIFASCVQIPFARCNSQDASVNVIELRTEYLMNPLGIDTSQPRLSWKLTAKDIEDRGQRQTAYRILVASSPARLSVGHADLWDSEWQNSKESHLVEYAGKPLKAGMQCFWKVSVRDEHNSDSDWSEVGHWTMGPLDKSDWQAKWIGAEDEFKIPAGVVTQADSTIQDPWFRKTIHFNSRPKRAEVYVASVGYHELYVNGRKVSDTVLAPAVSDHLHRARYVTYDIAPLLKSGKNAIALWLGTSWSIYPHYQTEDKPAAPIVLLQGDIHLADGRIQQIVTDATWKTHPSPNRLLGAWNFMNYGGEYYDSRQEILDWNHADFDDSDWESATLFQPKLEISAEMVEPNRINKEIAPVKITAANDDSWRVDMGVNFAGLLEVDVTGKPGTEITIRSSERKEDEETFRIHSKYVIGSSGAGTFRSRFNYHSGRWLTIEGLDRAPRPEEVRGFLVRSDFGRTGYFISSDERINRIYNTTLWTLENLCVGGYFVDCPQRERMGYGGDAHATILTALSNYGVGAVYSKWNQDWHDVQQSNGFVPYTAPTYWGGGGPAWSGFCITLPWEVYRQHGDRRILADSYPAIEQWLAFMEAHSADDMLVPWGAQGDWVSDEWSFLGDWVWPGQKGTNSHTPESLFFNNCYWIHNLQTAADIADALNRTEDASRYRSRAAEVRRAVHHKFFLPETNSYVNGFQGYLALALLVGLPPEEIRNEVWQTLEKNILIRRNGHIHAGITAGAMLLKTLMVHDRNDLIYAMALQPDEPGWLNMLDHGATTIWEAWDQERAGSRLHSSFLYIGAWPIHGLAGIRPGKSPGFSDFEIKPGVFASESGPEWVSARYDSDYGTIESSWRRKHHQLQLNVTVPPNTQATVYVPTTNPASVATEKGEIDKIEGVKRLGYDAPWLQLEVTAGRYCFQADLVRLSH